mmetsp:Transcript_6257/g.13708  ORF Transcript_6257/g.13708 Transcript_6257/m.13708 type:complete len:205 (-) Transcript_6257:378-992(-)
MGNLHGASMQGPLSHLHSTRQLHYVHSTCKLTAPCELQSTALQHLQHPARLHGTLCTEQGVQLLVLLLGSCLLGSFLLGLLSHCGLCRLALLFAPVHVDADVLLDVVVVVHHGVHVEHALVIQGEVPLGADLAQGDNVHEVVLGMGSQPGPGSCFTADEEALTEHTRLELCWQSVPCPLHSLRKLDPHCALEGGACTVCHTFQA